MDCRLRALEASTKGMADDLGWAQEHIACMNNKIDQRIERLGGPREPWHAAFAKPIADKLQLRRVRFAYAVRMSAKQAQRLGIDPDDDFREAQRAARHAATERRAFELWIPGDGQPPETHWYAAERELGLIP